MSRPHREPSVEQLWVAPELASLAVLEAAADTAILALTAVYPEMADEDPADHSATLRAAVVVIEDARVLTTSMARYRLTLRRAERTDDLLPF